MKFIRGLKERAIQFFQNEEGASAIEYVIIAGVVATVLLVGVQTLFGSLSATFSAIADVIPSP